MFAIFVTDGHVVEREEKDTFNTTSNGVFERKRFFNCALVHSNLLST